MTKQRRIRWKLGILAGLAVALVTMIPQLSLWIERGGERHGAYAIVDPDELAYSGYLNSIVNGKSRRNDPFLGGASTEHETYFSIQFVPTYALAFTARLLGLSTPTVFILFSPLFAFLSSLAVFWLLNEITGDEKVAAIGVLIALLCGVLASANILIEDNNYAVFSFLRRAVPAFPFPLFFVFFVCVWHAFNRAGFASVAWSSAAGALMVALIYSYFYLWTTAGALLAILAVLWFIFHKQSRLNVIKVLVIIIGFTAVAILPYVQMLAQISRTTEHYMILVRTHSPDLFRFTELLGALILGAIVYGNRKGQLDVRAPAVLFAAACAITPFIVLNQQVVTGRSLQPFHFDQFALSYLVLVAAVIVDSLWWRQITRRAILFIGLSLVVGVSLAAKTTKVNSSQNHTTDAALPLFAAIQEDVRRNPSTGSVVFDRTLLSAVAPSYTSSLPVLWSPYGFTYGSVNQQEDNERLFQYFYYLGVEEKKLEELLNGNVYRAGLFGLHRVNPTLTQKFVPVTHDEIQMRIRDYSQYKQQFSQAEAEKWPLSYVVLTADRNYDLSNLDRWYERDRGRQVGDSVIYRVRHRSRRQ
jgi:hypothetical protein